LHGGPGDPDRAMLLKYQSALAEVCTMVCWDQRGAGKAYNSVEAKTLKLTIDLCVEDAHEVILFLKKKFNAEKIFIVGHSWGSVLGTLVAQKYPEDIAAYVGVGQYVCGEENERISYQFVLNEARNRNDKKAIKKLNKIGQPQNGKYRKKNGIVVERNLLHKYGGAVFNVYESIVKYFLHQLRIMTSQYSFADLLKYFKAESYNIKYLDISGIDFLKNVKELNVPVYLLEGHHDFNCPYELAEKWFNQLKSPHKRLVWFENSAHFPQYEENKLWGKTLAKLLFDKEI